MTAKVQDSFESIDETCFDSTSVNAKGGGGQLPPFP